MQPQQPLWVVELTTQGVAYCNYPSCVVSFMMRVSQLSKGGAMENQRIIVQRARDLGGGFVVGRVLPVARQRMVGPFIFFDHLGPLELAPGIPRDLDIRPDRKSTRLNSSHVAISYAVFCLT